MYTPQRVLVVTAAFVVTVLGGVANGTAAAAGSAATLKDTATV